MAAFAMTAFFTGCESEPAGISCGKEWNPASQVVADTSSTFDLADQLIVQYRHGGNFDFTSLKVSFYEGTLASKGKEIWSRDVAVTEKMGSYTLQGKSKHGGLMTARELTHQKKPGSVVVEFSTGDKVLASKELTLVKNK